MAAFNIPDILDDLKTGLEAAVAGLYVRTVPAPAENEPNEGVVFSDVSGTGAYHAMAAARVNQYRTTCSIEGRIWAVSAETGSETGTASRNRVFALWNALVGILEDNDATVYTNTMSLVPDSYDYTPLAIGDGSYGAQITFTLTSLELV